jgi:hypothetical protein
MGLVRLGTILRRGAKAVILSEEKLVEARKELLGVALDRCTPDAAVIAVFLGGSLAPRRGETERRAITLGFHRISMP